MALTSESVFRGSSRFRKCRSVPDIVLCSSCQRLDCGMHDHASAEESWHMRRNSDGSDFAWLCPFDKSPCDVVDMCWSAGCWFDGYRDIPMGCSQTSAVSYVQGNLMRRKLMPFIKAVGRGRFCYFDDDVCGGYFVNCAVLGVGFGVWIGLCPRFKVK